MMSLLPKNCSCGIQGTNGLPDNLFLRLSVKGGLKIVRIEIKQKSKLEKKPRHSNWDTWCTIQVPQYNILLYHR